MDNAPCPESANLTSLVCSHQYASIAIFFSSPQIAQFKDVPFAQVLPEL
jgi:hypothetical protein